MPDALYTFTRTALVGRIATVVAVGPVVTVPTAVVLVAPLDDPSPESSRTCSPMIPRITATPITIAPRAPPEPGDRAGSSPPEPPLGSALPGSPDRPAGLRAVRGDGGRAR